MLHCKALGAARDLQFEHDALAVSRPSDIRLRGTSPDDAKQKAPAEKGSVKLSRGTGDLLGELGDAAPATHRCRAAFWLPGGERPPTAFLSHPQ